MATTPQVQPPTPPAQLKTGALGAAGITFMVVAAAAPLTILTGVAPLAISIGGIGAPAGYLIAGVVLAIFAVGFTAMTRHTRGAGAFYAYITLGLGRTFGAAAGMLAVISYNALHIGVYGLLGTQFAAAFTRFTGHTAPWWLFAGVGIVLVWALGRRGIDVGAKVLGVLLAAETLILALLVVAVLVQGGNGGLTAGTFSADALSQPSMLAIFGFCFAAFMGFESTALYRGEARRPDRTIPRATFAAVAFLALFYCLVGWAVVQAFGDAEVVAAAAADPAGLFFAAMDTYVGGWASDIMYVLVLTSVLASQLAFHNAINRYAFSLAHDGLLPGVLGRSHPRFLSPANAGAVQSVLAAVVVAAFAIAGGDPYLQLLLLVNTPGVLGVMVLQVLTSAAVLAYFLRRRSVRGARAAMAFAALATVLLALALWSIVAQIALLTGAGTATNAFLITLVPAVLAVGVGWSFYLKNRRPGVHALIGGEDVRRVEAATSPAPAASASEPGDPAAPAGATA
ncbi:amino acid/polyamine/organocation transporter (APC superfamily) [Nonomuraea polychroma]|uniref:Amino acid/polyamine/organocation transporter (APC superfamily) n=1 Tax=Nonomuraea polychroma TaxID=46176 RepID=A0A438M8I1_9ACTN|nr:APC family permease [Nonomuraea polychroma]RVX42007.1 amino acid/polyamine/organocation transporter (APC superfamily) [Nonomuraea polychroma]